MYQRTAMTEHLTQEHGVSDKQLSEAYENRNRDLSVSWDEFLELNHDVLHALARGEVVRAPGVRLA